MKILLLLVSGLFFCMSLPALTIAAAPSIYPVKGTFGFNAPELAAKAPAFYNWVSTRKEENLEAEFVTAFRNEFGSLAAENITDVNKHEVLVASLHLIRASQYVVPKLGNYEVHLPITLSIVITNPSTGEAIYSFTKTSYAAALLASPDIDAQAQQILFQQTESNYRSLLQKLIKETREGYSPAKIETAVAETWKGLYILDKGGKFGIARDDSLVDAAGNEIVVRYVTEDYAVAASLLGSVSKGQKFYKYTTASTAGQFSKPRVLTMHEGWKDPVLAQISYFFDSEVSKESAFTLLPVNEYFRNLLERLARDTYSGKFETTEQRFMPDYLIKFTATQPRAYTISQRGKFPLNIYEQYVLGELLDKQGRILFSAVGSNRIEDKNVGNMVFGKEARLEVVLKNAVVNLAEQFAKSIRFSRHLFPVKSATGDTVEVEDRSKELRIGQEVTIYRNIGRPDGISSDVSIPIWQATVTDVQNGMARLGLVMSLVDKGTGVSTDDQVILEAVSAAATADQSSTSVTYCNHTQPKLGSVDIDDFNVLSRASGYLLPYTLYDHDAAFGNKIRDAARFGGFRDSLKLDLVNTAGRCLLPVHKVSVAGKGCEGNNCTYEISMAAGYRLYAGTERKGAAASSTKVTVETADSAQAAVIQGEISRHLPPILKENIIKMKY